MHYYIISGEPSGDLYGSCLIEALKEHDQDSRFTCWGGSYMKNAGGNVVVDLESLSFMGFWEVFQNIRIVFRNLLFAQQHIKKNKPDAVILIDYPGFNLRIAQYAKKIGVPVFWFMAPQVWAWKHKRIHKIRKYVDALFVGLPFELEYFKQRGVNTFYFGHPMLDIIRDKINNQPSAHLGKSIIALLPGSRKQEVKLMLPLMLQVTKSFSQHRFVVICVQNIHRSFYEDLLGEFNIELKFNKDILHSVSAALVASGTATLELAIYNIPQVVCYKLHPVSFLIAKYLAKVKYISLVNILANKNVVVELIQGRCTVKNIESSLQSILEEGVAEKIKLNYASIIDSLGNFNCFKQVTKVIYSTLLGIKKQHNI